MSDYRIPRYVELPFQYTVKVVLSDPTDSKLEGEDGTWDVETRTIHINRKLPGKRRRYVLVHELGHAWLDFQHFCMDDNVARN